MSTHLLLCKDVYIAIYVVLYIIPCFVVTSQVLLLQPSPRIQTSCQRPSTCRKGNIALNPAFSCPLPYGSPACVLEKVLTKYLATSCHHRQMLRRLSCAHCFPNIVSILLCFGQDFSDLMYIYRIVHCCECNMTFSDVAFPSPQMIQCVVSNRGLCCGRDI